METEESALLIVQKLNSAGYKAYYAGGWVRDWLMGHPSADIDIATDAPPERIVALFPRTVQVGIAFGVVIVVMGKHNFEVATFRTDLDYRDGRRPESVHFSTPEEDAKRRDFTINGLFYDPLKQVVYDYVGGQKDIEARFIRAIGNPIERFHEDRLRMLRAIRFAFRFDFKIEAKTRSAIKKEAHTLLPAVSVERIWQELDKMAKASRFDEALIECFKLNLLQTIFPKLRSLSCSQLRHRLAFFKYEETPHPCPTILVLMSLFPQEGKAEWLNLCDFLKLSRAERTLVELFAEAKALLKSKDPVDTVHFFAKPHSDIVLRVCAGIYLRGRRHSFLKRHYLLRDKLINHIKRIQTNTPLVTAAHLMKEGVKPGKKMGELLREAERIAIHNDLSSADAVIKNLL